MIRKVINNAINRKMFSFGQKIETTLFFTENFDFAAEGLNGFLYPQLPGF